MWSIDSPKSIGEPIGKITEITTKYIKINTIKKLNNGDGLCFFNSRRELEGINVNRVENGIIYPASIPDLKRGTYIYRNHDHEFEKLLSKKSADRRIEATINVNEIPFGFSLEISDEDDNRITLNIEHEKQPAQKDQTENIRNNLSKTGTTIFKVKDVAINFSQSWFIPASILSEWRRQLTAKLLSVRKISYRQDIVHHTQTNHAYPIQDVTYLGNVMNKKGEQFYVQHQSVVSQIAFEKESRQDVPLMFTRHCIKQSLGWCPKEQDKTHPYKEPFFSDI